MQWLGEGPEPPYEDRDRVLDVELGSPGLRVRLISHEDLIIDRLNQAKHWNNPDGFLWAQAIANAARAAGHALDWKYLESRAEAEDITDLLPRLKTNG